MRRDHNADDLLSPVSGWLIMAAASVAVSSLVLWASLWHLTQAPAPERPEVRALRAIDANFRESLAGLRRQFEAGGVLELGSESALRRLAVEATGYGAYLSKQSTVFERADEVAKLRESLSTLEPQISASVGPGIAVADGYAVLKEVFEACKRRARASPTWAERVAAQDVVATLGRIQFATAEQGRLDWSQLSISVAKINQTRELLEFVRARPGLGENFCVRIPDLDRLKAAIEAGKSADVLRVAALRRITEIPSLPSIAPPGFWDRLRVRGAFPQGFSLAALTLAFGVVAVLMLVLRVNDLRRAIDEGRADVSASLSSISRFTEASLMEVRERLLSASGAAEALQEKIKAYGLVSWDLSAAGALSRTQVPLSNDAMQIQELAAQLREDFHAGEDNERVAYRISELISASDALLTTVRTFEKSLSMFREASITRESAQRDEIDRWRREVEGLLGTLRSDAKLIGERLQSLVARRT